MSELKDETGKDIAEWWTYDAPDTSDRMALAARIDKAIADAQERERVFWTGKS